MKDSLQRLWVRTKYQNDAAGPGYVAEFRNGP